MNSWQRLVFYLILNVLVSACTILTVLVIWDRLHQPADLKNAPSLGATLPAGLIFTATPSPVPAPPTAKATPGGPLPNLIKIDNVFGVGNLDQEVVVLKRIGDGELALTNWKLSGGHASDFVFPALTLYKDGGVQVHTGPGVNTVVDLYWSRDAAVWQEGDTVKLLDDQGNLRASYKIP